MTSTKKEKLQRRAYGVCVGHGPQANISTSEVCYSVLAKPLPSSSQIFILTSLLIHKYQEGGLPQNNGAQDSDPNRTDPSLSNSSGSLL